MIITFKKLYNKIHTSIMHGSSKGIVSAFTWQAANYIFPLITFPYLARILGPIGLGTIAFASAVAAYASLIAGWGFYLTGTQAIAKARDDKKLTNEIIWSITFAKIIIGFFVSIIIYTGVEFFVKDKISKEAILISLLLNFIGYFSLEWVLRGRENFKEFAFVSIIARAIALPLIFIFVKTKSDILIAMILGNVGNILASFIYISIIIKRKIIGLPYINIKDIILRLKEGYPIFVSNIFINIYTSSMTVILGFTSTKLEVGLYSSTEKIRSPVMALYQPIQMVFFPKLSYAVENNIEDAKRIINNIYKIQSLLTIILSIMLFLFAKPIVNILLGSGFEKVIPILRIQSFLVFVIGLSNVFGIMTMLPFGLKSEFSRSVLIGSVAGVILALPLSYFFGAIGISIAVLIAEMAVTSVMYYYIRTRLPWFPHFRSILWKKVH